MQRLVTRERGCDWPRSKGLGLEAVSDNKVRSGDRGEHTAEQGSEESLRILGLDRDKRK